MVFIELAHLNQVPALKQGLGTKEETHTYQGSTQNEEWITDIQQATKMSTKFKKEIGLISESPLSRSCTRSAENGRNQNNLKKKGLKYSLLQKIVTNTIL